MADIETSRGSTVIDWMALAQTMRDELIARRRDLHRHPELGFEEVRTAGIVANELNELGLEVTTGIGKTGVVGILEGSCEGPTVMARFDMDALPVLEENQTEYVSEAPGKMHACGHDGHTAIGLAVAKMLAGQRTHIAGRVKFVFQPAEEPGLGALAMIDDGVLTDPAPEICLGLHLWNYLPMGTIGLAEGPIMAGADRWEIRVRGSGGHGASPHLVRDPIVAAMQIGTALQTIVSRNVNGLDSAVVSITMFHAGDAVNVIPSEAVLAGTIRTYLPDIRSLVTRRMAEIAQGVASALQCEADVEIRQNSRPVVNAPEVTRQVRRVIENLKPSQPLQLEDNVRTMLAEDIAYFLERVPGTFIFVGTAAPEHYLNYPHHHPRFNFDEAALPVAAGLMAAAIADKLQSDCL